MKSIVLVFGLLISSLAMAQTPGTTCAATASGVTCIVTPPLPPPPPPPLPPITTVLDSYQMAIQTAAHTIWVALTGNDATCVAGIGVGNAELPCATQAKADALTVAGDVVRFLPGTWSADHFEMTKAGTAAAHIQYVSDAKWAAHLVGTCIAAPYSGVVFDKPSAPYVDVIGFDITNTGSACSSGVQLQGNMSRALLNNIHDISIPNPPGGSDGVSGGGGVHCYSNSGLNTSCDVQDNTITNYGMNVTACAPTATCVDQRWHYHGVYIETAGTVSGNTIMNTSGHGIQAYHAATANVIEYNTIGASWRSSILVSNDATGNVGSVVRYNTLLFPRLYCIDVSNATGAIIDHNTGSHCGSGTMRDTGTATTSTNWTLK